MSINLMLLSGVSSDDAGRRLFLEAPGMVGKLLEVLVHWQSPLLARDAALALINLSATPVLAEHLMQQVLLQTLFIKVQAFYK
jgi:hypothetical protein